MIGFFKRLFSPKRKDGTCKWWAHDPQWTEWKEYMSGTGKYIGGEEITEKRESRELICSKCGRHLDYENRKSFW